jgi:competence protein ComEC
MVKLYFIATIIFLLLFAFRVYQVGGIQGRVEFNEFYDVTEQFTPIRQALAAQVAQILPEPQAALLAGMLLGEKSNLPADFNNALRRTSTIHIVVVSGQNLTLVGGFFLGFVSILGRKKTTVLALIACFIYALLTGLQTPVIRAFIMFFFASLAQLFNRDRDGIWVLLLTGAIMLIFDPNYLLSISFQLSFLATVGVMVVAPEVLKLMKSLPDLLKQDLAVSFSAQLLTMPVIAYNFHTFATLGIPVNALVLFTVPLIMITGAVALIGGLISLTLGQFLAFIPGTFLTYFVYVIKFFDQSWSSLYITKTSLVMWLGYYVFLMGVFWLLKKSFIKEELVK